MCGGCDLETGESEAEGSGRLMIMIAKREPWLEGFLFMFRNLFCNPFFKIVFDNLCHKISAPLGFEKTGYIPV